MPELELERYCITEALRHVIAPLANSETSKKNLKSLVDAMFGISKNSDSLQFKQNIMILLISIAIY